MCTETNRSEFKYCYTYSSKILIHCPYLKIFFTHERIIISVGDDYQSTNSIEKKKF